MARKAKTTKAKADKASPRTIVSVQGANKGHDTICTLGDGSTHICTGWNVKVGQNFDTAKTAALATLRKEAEAKAATKGATALARGTETEKQSRAAHRANREAERAAKKNGKAEAKAARKTEKAKRTGKEPAKVTVLVKAKDSGLNPNSGRYAKLALMEKCKTTADFLGKVVKDGTGKEHKCKADAIAGMLRRAHIRLA